MRGEWDKGGMERKCFIDLFYILRQFRGKRYAIYVNYLKNIQKNDILGWNYPLSFFFLQAERKQYPLVFPALDRWR